MLTILTVVIVTWMFRAAIGIFFDFVVPVTFLALHVICDELSDRFRIVPRQPGPGYSRFAVAALVIVAVTLAGAVAAHEIDRVQHQLDTERRLQVAEVGPSRSYIPVPIPSTAPVLYTQKEKQQETEEHDVPASRVARATRAPVTPSVAQDKFATVNDPRFTAAHDLISRQTEEARREAALQEAVGQRLEAEMARLRSEYERAQVQAFLAGEGAKEGPAAVVPSQAPSQAAVSQSAEPAEPDRKTRSKAAASEFRERARHISESGREEDEGSSLR